MADNNDEERFVFDTDQKKITVRFRVKPEGAKGSVPVFCSFSYAHLTPEQLALCVMRSMLVHQIQPDLRLDTELRAKAAEAAEDDEPLELSDYDVPLDRKQSGSKLKAKVTQLEAGKVAMINFMTQLLVGKGNVSQPEAEKLAIAAANDPTKMAELNAMLGM